MVAFRHAGGHVMLWVAHLFGATRAELEPLAARMAARRARAGLRCSPPRYLRGA